MASNPIDFSTVTTDELLQRGWRWWTKESGVLLCSAVDFDNVPDGTIMTSISGRVVRKGVDYIDDDTRFGCLAFGVVRSDVGKYLPNE